MIEYTQERMSRAEIGVKSHALVVTTPTIEDTVKELIEISKKDKPTKYGISCISANDPAISREIRKFGDFYVEVVVYQGHSRQATEVQMAWC